jgi:hypothetical protein
MTTKKSQQVELTEKYNLNEKILIYRPKRKRKRRRRPRKRVVSKHQPKQMARLQKRNLNLRSTKPISQQKCQQKEKVMMTIVEMKKKVVKERLKKRKRKRRRVLLFLLNF